MIEETTSEWAQHSLPYGRTITLKNVVHESGMQMLRLTIREGRRFTIIDLDNDSAHKLADDLAGWADKAPLSS
ncbi:hypothetical protein MNBD_ALPHA12-105 [hydrothermal vent metagenome]|uniref:Uncharacterized protein n=1 Tax=hydrothermal vent metagenome TaxID=652676 RepID=A0A3B0TS40_9ZZZZ